MGVALSLAARGLGQVAPNPAVGCVIVVDADTRPRIIGRGWTQPGGRPHAETEALARAGAQARGATAYVSLEPCAHHGRTPPCAQALIDAGVARVVIGCGDPDPRVAGRGVRLLHDAGLTVVSGVREEEAVHLNAGFFSTVERGRPLVTLKIAATLDGKIATHTGNSQWITGSLARQRTHLMRAQADAIMIGSATAIVDDPQLTCRLPGLAHRSPIRVVADGRLRLPLTSRMFRTARAQPLIVLTRKDTEPHRRRAFEDQGVDLIDVPVGPDNHMDMGDALSQLAGRGMTRLLVEGGARLAASLLRADLVDRIDWFQAPKIIGDDGYSAVAGLGLDDMGLERGYRQRAVVPLGDDVLTRLEVRA